MQGISIFQQIYAPRVAHVVTGFDGVSHNTHSPYAMGGVVGSVGKMTAIVANDQADTWHIVNLKCGKIFDAVAVLGAFDESEAANMAMRYHGQYFDAVCGDVCESNTGGLQRFLNHPVYMRTNRPVYAEELAKLQDISSTQAILWDGVQLKSHNGSSKHLLLDMMRCDDDKALLEKMDFVEEESQLDGEIAEYDALVVEAYKLESTVSKLALAMDKATSISTLKVANQTLSKPKTMRGFGVIQQLVSFELSDGQAVSIIFNVSDSEANASAKMTKDDLLVAWKYKLNSRDITAAVQPNATQNVSLNMIASRIMGLADANSEKFVAAQKKKDAMQTELVNTNQRVKDLQGQEQSLIQEIADLQKQLDEKAKNNKALEAQKAEKEANKPKMPTGEELRQQGYNGVISELKKLGWADDAVTGGVSKSFIGASEKGTVNPDGVLTVSVTSKDGNMMAIVGDTIVRNSVVTIPQYGLTAQTEGSYRKEAEKINKAVNFYIDDVRPFIRGELLQDVFVVKKGGVYNSDLEMNNLNHSIKVFLPRGFEKDLKENMTVKATISREYKHDWRLKSVDEIIDDPLKQQREIQEAEYQKSVGYNQLKFIKDNADSLLYEMDAKKTDSITTIEGFGQKTTVTRQQVMDVIKERIPKPQPEPTQERPSNWRTNLANARAVAKSLGIETKGKKLERLVKEIDIFDEKEVKKELLSEFKALASRLVLPKGYVFDLSDAEKSIGDITRWVSPIIKPKGAFDFNKIRIELRAVTSINEYEGGVYISDYVFFYTEDKNAKKDMDSLNYPNDGNINASEPKTPKATVEKMEQFLIKAVFPKIEYLKVVNGTELDPSKLSELGIANIESIGNENIYIEKNGKYYISKVGNTEDYALGEWDFAKYPEGKLAAPVAQPVQTPVVPVPTPAAKSTDLSEEEYAALKKAYDEFNAKTDKIGAAKSREDALKIATDLVTEIPEKEYQIRRAFSDAIRNNKWYGFEINFPKQPVKVKTDAELNSTLKRLQKALEGTAYSVNGKFNYGSAKLKLTYNNGGSSWGNKYADKTIDQIKGKFVVIHDVYAKDAIEWMKPLVDGMLSWLNGETVPKMFLGNDLKWDTQIGTPRVIDDAFKEAKAKAAPAAPVAQPVQTPVVPEPTPAIAQPVAQTGARYESPKELFLKKANKAYKDLEDNGLKGFAKRANDVVQDVASNIVSLEDAEKRLNGIIYESENPLVSGEWRDLGDRKVYFWEDMRYGEIVDTRKTEGRSKNVSNPWRTGDGKLFESLSVAKQHELETTSKYMFINDGYMQKTKSSETQQPASEPPMTNPDRDYLQSIIDGKLAAPVTQPEQAPVVPEPTPASNKKMYTPKDILDSDLSIDEKISEAEKLLESSKLNAAKQKIKIDESNKFYLSHARNAEVGYLFTDLPKNASLASVVHAGIGLNVGFIEYLKNLKESPPKIADTQAQTTPDIGDTVIGDTTLSDLFKSDMDKKHSHSVELRVARQSILDAEDAAANAIQSNSIDAFSKYADMFPKTYNALLNWIKSSMTNPDRDYLQSIIDGDVDPLIVDMDAVIALAEKYDGDAEITPLLDQALEVINQAEQEAAKGI